MYIILTIASAILLRLSCSFTYTECGTVTNVYPEQMVNSGGKRSKVYIKKEIDVNFGTHSEVMNVDTRTFYNAKVGNKVCFEFNEVDRNPLLGFLFIISLACLITFGLSSIYLLFKDYL